MGKEYARGWKEARKDFDAGKEPIVSFDMDNEFVQGYNDGWSACLFRQENERERKILS